MNQDQVKEKLLQLNNAVSEFKVIFSGKKSNKVHGLYKPEQCEIIIHNKNFLNDNSLMHTAIHEFAHHIQFTTSTLPVSSKSHTSFFWNLLHKLLYIAEKKGIYKNMFKSDPKFIELTTAIKNKFLLTNGKLMKEFGQYLIKAHKLCEENQLDFDDYMDRELGLHRSAAKMIMRCSSLNINPNIGYENMKIVASIKDPEQAKQAEKSFMQGYSPDMIKTQFKATAKPENTLHQLLTEKQRIKSTIESLQLKLTEVEKRISEIQK